MRRGARMKASGGPAEIMNGVGIGQIAGEKGDGESRGVGHEKSKRYSDGNRYEDVSGKRYLLGFNEDLSFAVLCATRFPHAPRRSF